MKVLIGIPARYASTRLPGKPLMKIGDREMLVRVWETAQSVASHYPAGVVQCAIATEDTRILDFCNQHDMACYITSPDCQTGTDRIAQLADLVPHRPDFIVNLQGDNPTCPPWFIKSMIDGFLKDTTIEVITPVVNLSWDTLERFKESKIATPYSGTCCIVDLPAGAGIEAILTQNNFKARWFSKNIIPAIRKTDKLKAQSPEYSPILRHVGLYGFRYDVLMQIGTQADTLYSSDITEGLEQLKFISMGLHVSVVKVDYQGREALSGVDSPKDLEKATAFFEKYGDY